eukprot:TRINITY_DN10848_c0_g2_i1.p1 TRINITY_DN10848_c0_g2~~TRINITY_DN10848_c0_g2_i1.p1  ORF type:complete len:261 (-),score=90.96 TRINITY_DN10848_c0_g2_i1:115-795(-)
MGSKSQAQINDLFEAISNQQEQILTLEQTVKQLTQENKQILAELSKAKEAFKSLSAHNAHQQTQIDYLLSAVQANKTMGSQSDAHYNSNKSPSPQSFHTPPTTPNSSPSNNFYGRGRGRGNYDNRNNNNDHRQQNNPPVLPIHKPHNGGVCQSRVWWPDVVEVEKQPPAYIKHPDSTTTPPDNSNTNDTNINNSDNNNTNNTLPSTPSTLPIADLSINEDPLPTVE